MEACGLSDLGREDRILLAQEIVESSDLKQQICNDVDGLSFRDIEKVLGEILRSKADRSHKKDKKRKNEDTEDTHSQEEAEYDNSTNEERVITRKKLKLEWLLNTEEVNFLIEASMAPAVVKSTIVSNHRYDTYDEDECSYLISR
jgi:hypothetical protein